MNNLRYLSPKSPFSERGLAIASLKMLSVVFLLYVGMSFAFAKVEGRRGLAIASLKTLSVVFLLYD